MSTEITLITISNAYAEQLKEHREKERDLDKKILLKEKQLDRLRKINKELFHAHPHWTDELLRPLLSEIKKAFPDYQCDDGRLTPMGLGCRVTVFFTKNNLPPESDRIDEENSIYICFLPGELDKGELRYETGESKNAYASGTIGEINGFNNITKPIESIEEIIQFLKSQIKENGSGNQQS